MSFINIIISIIIIIVIKAFIINTFIFDINLKKFIIKPFIISSILEFVLGIDYIFRNYYYIIIYIN